jgi:N-methylhydantoinase B
LGFFGGLPGLPGQVLINGRAPDNPKGEQTLRPGDLVEVLLPGGGGYGPPSERDPALRERDLQQGYVVATGRGATGG